MLTVTVLAWPSIAAGQAFEYRVELHRWLQNRHGTLIITPDTIQFKSDQGKDSRTWLYRDIEQITVSSPTLIEITTYEDQMLKLGRNRIFRFKLQQGAITGDVSVLLMKWATRPIATSILPDAADVPQFELPVKHLHTFGGCHGVLQIFSGHILFRSTTRASDSRYWRYADIQHVGYPTRFRFDILSFENELGGPTRRFNFELKQDLPAGVYDYIWIRLHPSVFYPQHNFEKGGENK